MSEASARIAARGLPRLLGRHGGETLPVGLHVIAGEPEQPRVRHLTRHGVGRLDLQREAARERLLLARELLRGHRLRADAAHLGQELTERGVGDRVPHLRGGREGSDAAAPAHARVGAIRPSVPLTEDLEEPRVAGPAEHLIGQRERIPTGVAREPGGVAGHEVGLDGPRAMHQQDLRARALGHGPSRHGGGGEARPRPERLLRESARLRGVNRTGDHEQGPRRPHALRVERDEVLTRDAADRCFVRRAPVRMLPVESAREGTRGDAPRLRGRQRERGERLRAQELDLARGERGSQDDVREQLEGEAPVIRQDRAGHGEEVGACGGPERPTDPLDGRGDLIGVPGPSALREQAGHHLGQPRLANGIVEAPGGHRERHRDDRLFLARHHEQAEPIRERGLGEGRELGRRERHRGRRARRRLGREGRGAKTEAAEQESGTHQRASGEMISVSARSGRR